MDRTFFNGEMVGSFEGTAGSSTPRNYAVPAKLVHPGRNVIAVRVYDIGNNGGFMGAAADMHLDLDGGTPADTIPLAGPWQFKPGMEVTVVPYTTCGNCPSCRSGRVNACRSNQTLGVQRDGALTEFIAVPWQKLVRSEQLSLTELTLVEPLSVGFHAVDRGRVTSADTVLVFGCGMIGLGAVSGAALLRGARVIAVDVDDAKLALARKAGAAEVINSKTENLHDKLQSLTNGDGPGVVIEAVGLPATFRAAVDEVAFAGRVVYIGYAKEQVAYETKYFVMKELDIMGSRNATAQNFADVVSVLESRRYPVAETITRVVPFADAGNALAAWAADPSRVTKIHVEF